MYAATNTTAALTGTNDRQRHGRLHFAIDLYRSAISDVALFHIDRLQPNGEIALRTTKADACLHMGSAMLQERIRARASSMAADLRRTHDKSLDVITDLWRRKLNKVWELCGPWKDKPTPHRFHTPLPASFAKTGVTVRDVPSCWATRKRWLENDIAHGFPNGSATNEDLARSV